MARYINPIEAKLDYFNDRKRPNHSHEHKESIAVHCAQELQAVSRIKKYATNKGGIITAEQRRAGFWQTPEAQYKRFGETIGLVRIVAFEEEDQVVTAWLYVRPEGTKVADAQEVIEINQSMAHDFDTIHPPQADVEFALVNSFSTARMMIADHCSRAARH